MIHNLLKRRWISTSTIASLSVIPDQFSVFMITNQNDKIPVNKLSGKERWVKALAIEFMDGRKIATFTVNDLNADAILPKIKQFVEQHQIKGHLKADLQKMQDESMRNTTQTLGIDNNIETLPRQITFHLNDYNKDEREKMIAYLSSVDSSSVDVVINLDFSRCSKEQLEGNDDFLLFAGAITGK